MVALWRRKLPDQFKMARRSVASGGGVVVVAIAHGARFILPPALHFPSFGLGLDAVRQVGVDRELERLAGPLRVEADFVEHPRATGGLGVAKLAAIGHGDQGHSLLADARDDLHNLRYGGRVPPLGVSFAQADGYGQQRLITCPRR